MAYKTYSMKSIAQKLNNLTYTDYYNRIKLIARSCFEWENLPNGIEGKWIERFLFDEGRCLFFNDKEKGFMVAKCNDAGTLNSYDEPTVLMPHGIGYTGNKLKNYEECIVIQNNDDAIATKYAVELFALRLASITRTADVNINAQKTPLFIACSDKQLLTMKNIFKKVNENEIAIFGNKEHIDIDSIKVFNTAAPIVFDKLRIEKNAIWNECMTFLGVNNANQDKRERLVADEVSANDEQIEQSAEVMLQAREQACKDINALFGTNISVKLKKRSQIKIELPKLESEVE